MQNSENWFDLQQNLFQIVHSAFRNGPLNYEDTLRLRRLLKPYLEMLNINSPLPIAFHTVIISLDVAFRLPMNIQTQHLLFRMCNCILCRALNECFQKPPKFIQTMECINWVLSWAQETIDKVKEQSLPQLHYDTLYILRALLRGVSGSMAECFEPMLEKVSNTRSIKEMHQEIRQALVLWDSNLQSAVDLQNEFHRE